MKTKILSFILATVLFASCGNSVQNKKENKNAVKDITVQNTGKTIYQKAGIIKLKEPKALTDGYRQPDNDIFEISLDDVGKYTGHICAGITSGFLLTKQALSLLYPNGETPVRGQISIASSAHTDQLEVASYIVRARQYNPEGQGKNIAIVDTNIASVPGTVTLIFKRADNGKMAKAVFNKAKLLTPEVKKSLMPLMKKRMNGTASDNEKTKLAKMIKGLVKQVITNPPEGVITVSEFDKYEFPKQ